jgi:uncharacterized protein with HEPN domain
MPREFLHVLDDMHDAIHGIEMAVANRSFNDYQTDWLLRHALQRAIEIISEASRALPDDIKALRPEVPWPQIKAIGNVLRHEYHRLSDKILWGVIVDEIPRLGIAINDLWARFAADESQLTTSCTLQLSSGASARSFIP